MELALLVLVVALIALVVLGVLLVFQLILQNGRILMRLEALEELLAPLTDRSFVGEDYVHTLKAGIPAPAFSLPDLNGVEHSLSEWRGDRILLVFFDPNCTFSRRLLPSLAALESDVVPGRPLPVIVSTGSIGDNRAIFDEAGVSFPVLLQKQTEVAASYRVDGTPMSYLISADGMIAAEIAVGAQAVLILAGEMGSVTDLTDSFTPGEIKDSSPGLGEPAAVRKGVKPGAMAPVFRLPRVGGGELSLLEYRGRHVLLVFSDPDCKPCDELATVLEKLHRDQSELSVVMISRGNAGETSGKIAEFGLTFPVVLQRHWEISREYGIFATPAAYFIDEWGTIGADVAVSPEDISALIKAAVKDGIR